MGDTLVTGGSGLVGLTLKHHLPDAIYVTSGEFDLRDESNVRRMFERYRPTRVVHLAGRVAGIYDHLRHPVQYFEENLLMNTYVLRYAHQFGAEKFIGMLSTCIYPDVVDRYPLNEADLHNGPPTATVFSYAYSKRSFAVQIDAYNRQYGLNYNYLIPCNLYGEHDKFDPNHSHYLSDLIRKIALAKNSITLFGTGKPIRQFMHADDLATVIIHYLTHDIQENVNVATPEVKTILEIAEIAVRACERPDLFINFDAEKVDGQYRKDVSIDQLLRVMPTFTCTSLFTGIRKTYAYFQDRSNSLRGFSFEAN